MYGERTPFLTRFLYSFYLYSTLLSLSPHLFLSLFTISVLLSLFFLLYSLPFCSTFSFYSLSLTQSLFAYTCISMHVCTLTHSLSHTHMQTYTYICIESVRACVLVCTYYVGVCGCISR